MEVKRVFPIELDFRDRKKVPLITVPQNDTNIFQLSILDAGQPADLSDVETIRVNFRRPDKGILTDVLTSVGNVVEYLMPNEAMAVAGIGELNVQLYSGGNKLSSMVIDVYVKEILAEEIALI